MRESAVTLDFTDTFLLRIKANPGREILPISFYFRVLVMIRE